MLALLCALCMSYDVSVSRMGHESSYPRGDRTAIIPGHDPLLAYFCVITFQIHRLGHRSHTLIWSIRYTRPNQHHPSPHRLLFGPKKVKRRKPNNRVVPHSVKLQLCFITGKSGSAREIFHACNFFAESRGVTLQSVSLHSCHAESLIFRIFHTENTQNKIEKISTNLTVEFVNAIQYAGEKEPYTWCSNEQWLHCSNPTSNRQW